MSKIAATKIVFVALFFASTANADWSANIGWASDYYYRGIFQSSSSAAAGVDLERGGFYADSWTADVGNGLEVDGYFGYGCELGDFSYGIGFTGYYYTQDFACEYFESGYSASLAKVDLGLFLILAYDDLVGQSDETLVFSVSKSFDF